MATCASLAPINGATLESDRTRRNRRKIGVRSGAQKIVGRAHRRQSVDIRINQHVTVLADRIAHPERLGNAADAFADEWPNHDQSAIAAAGHDRKVEPWYAAARRAEIVVCPVPAEIERLEDVRWSGGANEEVVPLGFKGVEVLTLCDQPQVNLAGGGFGCLGGRVVFCVSLEVVNSVNGPRRP